MFWKTSKITTPAASEVTSVVYSEATPSPEPGRFTAVITVPALTSRTKTSVKFSFTTVSSKVKLVALLLVGRVKYNVLVVLLVASITPSGQPAQGRRNHSALLVTSALLLSPREVALTSTTSHRDGDGVIGIKVVVSKTRLRAVVVVVVGVVVDVVVVVVVDSVVVDEEEDDVVVVVVVLAVVVGRVVGLPR